jgi:holo-[acyl-carrier protein] synthase
VIAGIGVDIAEVARVERAIARTPALAERLFAESERDGLPRALASCFAAKEAVAKALGAPRGLHWTDAVLRHEASGRPALEILGTVAVAAADLNISAWHVSISHDGGFCVAMVVAER